MIAEVKHVIIARLLEPISAYQSLVDDDRDAVDTVAYVYGVVLGLEGLPRS